jgi:Domain of unknown function (DUF6930)
MTPPTLEEWHRLYDLARQVKALAPWQWMTESELFGVQNPETKELGFIGVMGMVEEHFAVSVYRGAEGSYRFWAFEQAAPFVEPMELFQIPQLQASFEDRDLLASEDRAVIKQLGLKFRGRNAWPLFRDYRPGFVPWFIDGSEARFLTYALEQLLEVAPRAKTNPSLLDQGDIERYLVRVLHKQKGWTDQVKRVRPPKLEPIDVAMDLDLLDAVKKLPRSHHPVEVDCFLIPAQIGEKGTRPYYPYMLLVVDAQDGLVLGVELLEPRPSVEAMWGKVPQVLVQRLAGTGVIPQEVQVRSLLLAALLVGVAEELRIQVKHVPMLSALEAARSELEGFLRR